MRLNVLTICYNGWPYITRHYERLCNSDTDWQWTIVYGKAQTNDCTMWCAGVIDAPEDGTLEYLESLSKLDPRVILLKEDSWRSKVAMCNAALLTFTEPGLLLQMDADEVWTPQQFRLMTALFDLYPSADCAQFVARVWVGPRRFVATAGAWGNYDYEWLRLWKWEPGRKFLRHEPPTLEGAKVTVLKTHTAQFGLTFDHYSYQLREQIEFKSKYYGPAWDVAAWEKLQAMRGPVDLHGVLPWVASPTVSVEI